jgi:hypothetical protein
MMHRRLSTGFVFLFVVLGVAAAGRAQSGTVEQYFGTYSGTWDGSGTGTFELTLAKGADGEPGGKVAVTSDGGDYNAELKAVAFDGSKMTAKYDFPLDPSAEVVVAATFDAGTAKGTWSLHAKGQTDEIAGGTWTVTKK